MEQQTHNYASSELCLISDLVDMADCLATDWVFRGQPNARWDITSSLERETSRVCNKNRAACEADMLKRIKLATSFDECRNMDGKDDFSWLALLQHHGGKTRLVDFTESFYVALYFAIRDLPAESGDNSSGEDAAVWAIRTSKLDTKLTSLFDDYNGDLSEEEKPRRLINNSIELPDRYQDDNRLAIVHGKPEKLNQRMIAQQGLFLASLNLRHSFMENLTTGLGLTGRKEPVEHLNSSDDLKAAADHEKVIKIRIPQSLHRNILFHLNKMNISEATLFPGLDGFSRSLNYFAVGME